MFKKIRYIIIKTLSKRIAKCGKLFAIERIEELRSNDRNSVCDLMNSLLDNHTHLVNDSEIYHEDMINDAVRNAATLSKLILKVEHYSYKYNRSTLFGSILKSNLESDLKDHKVDISNTFSRCEQVFGLYDAIDVLSEGMSPGKRATIRSEVDYLTHNLTHGGFGSDNELKVTKLILPLLSQIRRLENIDEFVGYQPMTGPVDLVYRLMLKHNRPPNLTDEEYQEFLDSDATKHITLETVSQAVEARSRRLQAGWTIETVQDAKAQHGIDIESEILHAMATEIALEMEIEILARMYRAATHTAKIKQGAAMTAIPLSIGNMANEIARKTRRGPGNFVIVDPLSLTTLQITEGCDFVPCKDEDEKKRRSGAATTYAGILNKTIRVYVTPYDSMIVSDTEYEPAGLAIVGYKGSNSETDAGLIYCPYVTLMSTGAVMDPNTFQPTVGFMTRYGISEIAPSVDSPVSSGDYYAALTIPSDSISFDRMYPPKTEILIEDESPSES